MSDYDLVIRHGTILDGSGGAPFEADLAIAGGRIAAIGRGLGAGVEEIEARGRLVTPGFVDVHTHYDGQASWGQHLTPSTDHGVTTLAIGNCGVGFAPCRKSDRAMLLRLMEGVEDSPGIVLAEGVPFAWESYPQYLDFLGARSFDADIASYLPHAALRAHAMGERAGTGEAPAADELEVMRKLLAEAMAVGSLGLSSSQTSFHRSADGTPSPTLAAGEAEYGALADVLRDAGGGLMQFALEWVPGWEEKLAMLGRLARRSGRPVSLALTQSHPAPDVWPRVLRFIEERNAEGLSLSAQVLSRPLGLLLGLELSLHPFYTTPTCRALAHLPHAELLAALRDPAVKARVLAEANDPDPVAKLGQRVRDFGQLYPIGDPPDYEPPPERSVAAMAAARGMAPESLAYDMMLEEEGRAILYLAFSNYADRNLEPTRAMLAHGATVPGLGDGGAHLGTICDASSFTYALTHWGRDRTRGEKLPLPLLVRFLTRRGAELLGLRDRGLLAMGYRADVNVIDFERLSIGKPFIRRDLPAGGRRLLQASRGYDATILNGVVVRRDGVPTGALPGRLVRGARQDG